MLWRLFQAFIVMLVMFANIYFGWTPNPYLPAVWGILAAVTATWLLSKAIDLLRRGKRMAGQ